MNTTDLICFFLGPVHWQKTPEDITASVTSCVLSSIFALTAVLGNGTIMFIIWKTRELHSPSFALLFCLAVSDFLVGMVGQPSFVAFKIAELKENFSAYCNLRIVRFFCGWITAGVSFLTLSGVCIDRLLALTLHLRYKSIVTVRRALIFVTAVWMLWTMWTISKFWIGDKWHIVSATLALLPIVITALCTFQIFKIARKHQRQLNQQNLRMGNEQNGTVDVLKCKKSAVTVLYIYGLLLVFYLPFLAVMVVETRTGYTQSLKIAYDYVATVVLINSSVNPFIYCWRLKQIRLSVKKLIGFGH